MEAHTAVLSKSSLSLVPKYRDTTVVSTTVLRTLTHLQRNQKQQWLATHHLTTWLESQPPETVDIIFKYRLLFSSVCKTSLCMSTATWRGKHATKDIWAFKRYRLHFTWGCSPTPDHINKMWKVNAWHISGSNSCVNELQDEKYGTTLSIPLHTLAFCGHQCHVKALE